MRLLWKDLINMSDTSKAAGVVVCSPLVLDKSPRGVDILRAARYRHNSTSRRRSTYHQIKTTSEYYRTSSVGSIPELARARIHEQALAEKVGTGR